MTNAIDPRQRIAQHKRMQRLTILPAHLGEILSHIASKLEARRRIDRDIAQIASLFATLGPVDLPRAENEIVNAASLWRRERSAPWDLFFGKVTDLDQLKAVDGLEYIFIFHRDGRIREAALRKMRGPVPNAFFFAAISWRLNDWAAPVRQAAVDCATRMFPETPPEIIAEAGMVLLTRQATWRRWGPERAVWEAVIARRDVASCFAQIFASRTTGPMASFLRQMLRSNSMDEHLAYLATEGVQPAVRAAAIKSLLDGYAEWPSGQRFRWIDKSMGHGARETAFEKRSLTVVADRQSLIRRGLRDPAVAVRNTAISGLIQNQSDIADARQLALTMIGDRSRAVRERAEFILNRPHPQLKGSE